MRKHDQRISNANRGTDAGVARPVKEPVPAADQRGGSRSQAEQWRGLGGSFALPFARWIYMSRGIHSSFSIVRTQLSSNFAGWRMLGQGRICAEGTSACS